MTEIDSALVEEVAPHYTELRPVLVGSFNLSRSSIPFFQTTMSLEDVAKSLELVENLPSDLRQKWRLEELFQREIDWARVEQDIVNNYLRRPEKLQFFNALTVALLPVDERQHLAREYGEAPNPPEPREAHKKAPWRVRNIGGVQLITADNTPHGFIRWDPKRIFAATIDGQHRLAALKRFFEHGNLTQRQQRSTVSVIMLVLDPTVGLEIDEKHITGDDNPVLTVVREIFIDLNRTAKEVARSRRILLDDQEIESRCVRRLMAQRVGEKEEGVLPLGLVHWQHKVTAKFNAGESTGTFITTVELLYAIVRDILGVYPPSDPLEADDVRKFVGRVNDALGVDKTILEHPARFPNMLPLMAFVERNYLKEGFEKPFSNLPGLYLKAADEGFMTTWRKPIVSVLTEFEPYRRFIAQVDERGGIDGELAFYLCLPEKAQKIQADDWGEARHDKIDRPLRELAKMKLDDWPFYAVFQKGLMRATADAWKQFSVVGGKSDPSMDGFIRAWIGFLNAMYERGLFAVKCPMAKPAEGVPQEGCGGLLWSGIAVNPGAKTVKWNEVTVTRISGLLTLWWYFYALRLRSVPKFLKSIVRKDSNERLPMANSALKKLREGIKSSVVSTEESDLAQDIVDRRVESRCEAILSVARHQAATDEEGTRELGSPAGEPSQV